MNNNSQTQPFTSNYFMSGCAKRIDQLCKEASPQAKNSNI